MTESPSRNHGGMACMTAVLQWMAASSAEGTGKEGEEALHIREILDCVELRIVTIRCGVPVI